MRVKIFIVGQRCGLRVPLTWRFIAFAALRHDSIVAGQCAARVAVDYNPEHSVSELLLCQGWMVLRTEAQ
jgi:hypothetical protein